MRQRGVKMDVFFFKWTVFHRLTLWVVYRATEKAIDLGIDGASGDVDY
jgi:hypothetical protein